jgi:multisubunit Na+/H+ antiporter MnhE subunit
LAVAATGQTTRNERWRAATAAELAAALPSRAVVEKEHIETEMRTANGIINSRNQMIAAVVLITAGYEADGKYSHYLLVQSPLMLDGHLTLKPGSYVVGWRRSDEGLEVHFFDSVTGVERGVGIARPESGTTRVESFRIWPPGEHKDIQIGRFFLPYSLP